jgi:hypothetical protein
MIRDTGVNVEFWIKTGPQTYNYQQPWGGRINNAELGTRSFRMLQGGQWQFIDAWRIDYDQDVRFTILNSGLGFPSYDFWQHISRSSAPGPPDLYQADAVSSTHIHVRFSDGYDGGSPITERMLGYGTDPYTHQFEWNAPAADEMVGPFNPGTKVYFWARTRNAIGWGAWSNRGEATTWRNPGAPNAPTFSNIAQMSLTASFTDKANGGTDIIERQIGYGLDPNTPSSFAGDISGVNNIAGLSPGQTYYFWARSRNSIGWSPWSARSQATLIAGARVVYGGVWRRAVPYVRDAGVWKVARPWVKSAGEWKEAQ